MVSQSHAREEESKGNPVKIRDYPRSCKFQFHIWKVFRQPLPLAV